MNKELLRKQWLEEETVAHIRGWDFSHIHGRYEEEKDLPWDYRAITSQYLKPDYRLLDMDTGGGEFLLSLQHPYQGVLPCEDEMFDMVINRHGSFHASELYRVLKPNGIFITEQVGAENDRALVDLLLPGTELPFPELYLNKVSEQLAKEGFMMLQAQEAFRPIKFYDVGALVWFARIIEWEFPNFTVDGCLAALYRAQEILEKNGCIEGKIHRFLIVARK